MIIYGGKIFESNRQDYLLNQMEEYLNNTLATKTLDTNKVINAIDALGKEIAQGKYDEIFSTLQIDDPQRYKNLAIAMLSRENILYKLQTELGSTPDCYTTNPPHGLQKITVKRMPLGVIFHIAAGNADGLPAFSLAEGLLTGNVNILKLPQADNDLSLKIIFRLIELEPSLADFIFVFDTPSSDVAAMRKMANLADGISVWGGDAAIAAVRNLAPVSAKLIEWGHKLSFCYIADWQNKQTELAELAEHIAQTKQFLCSSCQTVFLDTDDMNQVNAFCDEFLPILQQAVDNHQSQILGERAHFSLIRHTELLEDILANKRPEGEKRGSGCRVIACTDSQLELSPMMCSVLVKRLPQNKIASELRSKKGYLQTAGLICDTSKREALSEIFARLGVVKITSPANMSEYFSGEAHDGEYPLQRYTRIVNIEQ